MNSSTAEICIILLILWNISESSEDIGEAPEDFCPLIRLELPEIERVGNVPESMFLIFFGPHILERITIVEHEGDAKSRNDVKNERFEKLGASLAFGRLPMFLSSLSTIDDGSICHCKENPSGDDQEVCFSGGIVPVQEPFIPSRLG